MTKKNSKRIQWEPYDVLKIDLGDGTHCYAHVAKHSSNIFYDYKGKDDLSLDKIIKLPIAFRVAVYKDVITNENWVKVGNVYNPVLDTDPYKFKQDPISGKLYIYHQDFSDTNYERPATLSECEGLERAAVWEASHVMDRLRDHFSGVENKWVKSMAIKKNLVP